MIAAHIIEVSTLQVLLIANFILSLGALTYIIIKSGNKFTWSNLIWGAVLFGVPILGVTIFGMVMLVDYVAVALKNRLITKSN